MMECSRVRTLLVMLLVLPSFDSAFAFVGSPSLFARVQSSIAPAQRCLVTRPMNMASPGSTEPSVETVAARVASTVTRDPVSREIGTGSSSAEQGLARLPWQADGYLSWQYDGHKVNYVDEGDKNKPALVLIHGFGASVYHWRYNIPALVAQGYRVLALDLLGFGLSDKPLLDYSAETWRDQVCAFVREVAGGKAIVAGNSLGGFTALAAAAHAPDAIKGCVMVNGAGRFRDRQAEAMAEAQKNAPPRPPFLLAWDEAIKRVGTSFQKAITRASFYYTKQPARIKQVLCQVYSDPRNVDDELVESIRVPSLNPNAAEVFDRVIARTGKPGLTVDELLEDFQSPLLLLWGDLDPWIRPAAADKIQALYSKADRVSVQAGHCPHDEAPEVVNAAMVKWLKSIRYG